MRLKDNTILITGATSGIGLALLNKLHSLGNNIIAVSRDPEKLHKLADDLPGVTTIQSDLSQQESVRKLLARLQDEHKALNVLINNAGVQYNYTFGRTDEEFDKIEPEMRINLISPVQLCHGLIPVLEQHTEAAIVNVSSGLGLAPKKSAPVYCGTKGGMHIFTKALRYQLEGSSIKVFEIIPPLVDTPMTAGRGSGKITPEQLAYEFVEKFGRNRFEINIGKVKLLRIVQRILPRLADRILKNV